MKQKPTSADWLPLARIQRGAGEIPSGAAFRPEWIDFERGIRVGNLEPHERITRILKYRLEQIHGVGFVTDRWGRGVYWQWICWLPRPNREAKQQSRSTNFGCAKFYISVDREPRRFRCGFTVERGYVYGGRSTAAMVLKPDWDWHRLMRQCRAGTPLDEELRRLVRREGFHASVSGPQESSRFNAENFRSARQIREAAHRAPPEGWAGFDLFYPMPEDEVRSSTGYELVQGILGAFAEVVPTMNRCMQVPLSTLPDGRLPHEEGEGDAHRRQGGQDGQ